MCSATCGAYSARYGSVSQVRMFSAAAGRELLLGGGGVQLCQCDFDIDISFDHVENR